MKKKNYSFLISSLYFNYIFQGMAAIILSQNLESLKIHWTATTAEVTLVMSAIGLGRVISLSFSGYFSDTYGRKKTALLAITSYCIFYFGLLLSANYQMAFFFALFGGFSNAFLDTSTYPTLVEAYPDEKTNSALSVLNKAFISLGQFILPFLTRYLLKENLFFGWTFIACALCLMANMAYLFFATFPKLDEPKKVSSKNSAGNKADNKVTAPKLGNFKIEGVALLVFSFVSVSIFNIFILWVPQYAQEMNIVSYENSLMFVSVYSVGSFISVFLTSFIVRKGVSIPKLISVSLVFSAFALLLMLLVPTLYSLLIASIFVGVFAAGGIWQLGLSLMLDFFPSGKGRYTSYYSLATSISVMITPYLTGVLCDYGTASIFWFDFFLVLIGLLASGIIQLRYKALATDHLQQTTNLD